MKTTQMWGLTNLKTVRHCIFFFFFSNFHADQNKIWKFFAKPVDLKALGSPAHMHVTD